MRTIILSLVIALAFPAACAEETTGTLKKVKDNDLLVIGYRESSVPWSYLDANQKVVGYSHEVALKIYDAIKADLRMPDLQLREIPITAQNRISLMQNGTIDLECNGTTNTSERRKQVAFSNTIAYTQTQLLTKKKSGIREFDDIKGKIVVVTAGHDLGALPSQVERGEEGQRERRAPRATTRRASSCSRPIAPTPSSWTATSWARSCRGEGQGRLRDHRQAADEGSARLHAAQGRSAVQGARRRRDREDADLGRGREDVRHGGSWRRFPPDGVVLNAPLTEAMRDLYAHPNDQSFD